MKTAESNILFNLEHKHRKQILLSVNNAHLTWPHLWIYTQHSASPPPPPQKNDHFKVFLTLTQAGTVPCYCAFKKTDQNEAIPNSSTRHGNVLSFFRHMKTIWLKNVGPLVHFWGCMTQKPECESDAKSANKNLLPFLCQSIAVANSISRVLGQVLYVHTLILGVQCDQLFISCRKLFAFEVGDEHQSLNANVTSRCKMQKRFKW